jgi:hypothetical protein
MYVRHRNEMEVSMSEPTTPQRLIAAPVLTPGSQALDLHEIQGDFE